MVTVDPGKPAVKANYEFRVPVHGAYVDTSKPTVTWTIRFIAACLDAAGHVQRGDPDVTIYYTYEWVGK